MSNNEILHTANDTAIDKTIQLTKMYKLKFMNSKPESDPDHLVTEFFMIVGCYDQDPEEYIRAYQEVHMYEINKQHGPFTITNFECEEATHHEPDLNLLDLRYGHSDKGLAVYDHSNCTIESLNYGWSLEDIQDIIEAKVEEEIEQRRRTPLTLV